MILGDFLSALGQIGDPRFRRVLILGIGLSLALLVAATAGLVGLVELFVPDSVTLPFVGPVGGLDLALGWGTAFLGLGLSVVLMVPVASAFTSLLLDDVAQAVEDRHYPGLPPPRQVPWLASLWEAAAFLALLLAANLGALLLYPFAGPLSPFVFWFVNGFLLGREYFTLVANRRLPRHEAAALRSRHAVQIWVAGVLMAAPLSVPVLNLAVPVLGAATFTHLVHRLLRRA